MTWLRPAKGRADWHRIARSIDYSSRRSSVVAPTLVLCGRHDPQYPISSSHRSARDIPDARMVTFERSGHFPFVEVPDFFWARLAEFLNNPGGLCRRVGDLVQNP